MRIEEWWALDAVGYLGHWRARRATIVTYTETLNKVGVVVHALVTLAGLGCHVDYPGALQEYMLPISIQGGENVLGAIWRSMVTGPAVVVPAPDGFGVDVVGVWPPESRYGAGFVESYRGRQTRMPYVYGPGDHAHEWIMEVEDVRNFGQAHIEGSDGTDLVEGEGMAMGWAAVDPGSPVRPTAVAIRDPRIYRLDGAANTQRRILQLQQPAIRLRATANLGLELYSTIAVTDPWLGLEGEVFRVTRLIETWERGELKQHVYGVREPE